MERVKAAISYQLSAFFVPALRAGAFEDTSEPELQTKRRESCSGIAPFCFCGERV
jgi:hypothetical protein